MPNRNLGDEIATERALLFGSESLTREEELLREKLIRFIRSELRGARPIALQAALHITSNMAARGEFALEG